MKQALFDTHPDAVSLTQPAMAAPAAYGALAIIGLCRRQRWRLKR